MPRWKDSVFKSKHESYTMKTSIAKIMMGVSLAFVATIGSAEKNGFAQQLTSQAHSQVQEMKAQVPLNGGYALPKKPKGSVLVGELTSGGDAKEVAVNRVVSKCYLELVSGTVSINTVVVRPEKLALPQAVSLTPGQLHVIDLGVKRNVTGFRISDNGRGVYRVYVK